MAKIDKLKERIAFFRLIFSIVIATFLAISGWIATNIDKAQNLLLLFAAIIVIFLAIMGVLLYKRINNLINKLEDL